MILNEKTDYRRIHRLRWWLVVAIFVWTSPLFQSQIAAQADIPTVNELASGLVGAYRFDDATVFRKVDEQINFHWKSDIPAKTSNTNNLNIRWDGFLFVNKKGKYRFECFSNGNLHFDLNGVQLLDVQHESASWSVSDEVELDYGWQPVRIRMQATSDAPQLSICWSGPGFGIEPVTAWFHQPSKTEKTNVRLGQRATQELGCARCHELSSSIIKAQPAADLESSSGFFSREWLADFLTNKKHGQKDRSPRLNLAPNEAAELVSALATPKPAKDENNASNAKTIESGRILFHSLGCLACHQVDDVGNSDLLSFGGDLTSVGSKRPHEFFDRWLKAPQRLNKNHRMPLFELTGKERRAIADYLFSLKTDEISSKPIDLPPRRPLRELLRQNQCDRCHGGDSATSRSNRTAISSDSNWERSCIERAGLSANQPRYELNAEVREAIRAFNSITYPDEPEAAKILQNELQGSVLIEQRGCVNCHSRGSHEGIKTTMLELAAEDSAFREILPAAVPPSLNGIGDKYETKQIEKVIDRTTKDRRPWLKIRMPKYRMTPDELKQVSQRLVSEDRLPARSSIDREARSRQQVVANGARLVTADGFGCTSCHQIGDSSPNKAPVHLLGPDLSRLGDRVRRSWFDRWIHDPGRMVPRIEMPSIQRPVQGILDDRLDHQIDALWDVLSLPDFNPPEPNPVRIVRHAGLTSDRAEVLTDVTHANGYVLIKPFLVGLWNRHNILFDFESARMRAWSIGDTARQRTKGKTWFWKWSGTDVWSSPQIDLPSEFSLQRDDKSFAPNREGQFVSQPIGWQHHSDGRLQFSSKLQFSNIPIIVVQEIRPISKPNGRTGFDRLITARNVPHDCHLLVHVDFQETPESSIVLSEGRLDETSASIALGSDQTCRITYTTSLPIDTFVPRTPIEQHQEPSSIYVAPGFRATRIPTSGEMMPTGFSWRPSGSLVVTSLKGRVWELLDGDGDQIEDTAVMISDELAAPYGVSAAEEFVDVVNKYGLLRINSTPGKRATSAKFMASGWGHTDDYHDWTVGLPKDEQGNYYITTACQQDERTDAAAEFRGRVIRLRKGDDGFHIEELTAGHRFPMGIARSRSGHLFVTDNQGNYNPFNELNHVREGSRYGFINQSEKKPNFNPLFVPPAINIPHPWTRSVNGICFLETPASLRLESKSVFGPFEGHLVGCEYDTHRLVRMSLQRVGSTFQGGIYPLTDSQGAESLLGPICCAVSPQGDIYIGEMKDSGWGGGNNRGTIVRLRPHVQDLPAGIAEITATTDGFRIQFTKPVNQQLAANEANYQVSSFTRVSTPAYGGDDKDRRTEKIQSLAVSSDGLSVEMNLGSRRLGFVYEFHLKSLVAEGTSFFPAEAFYTLNQIPSQRPTQ